MALILLTVVPVLAWAVVKPVRVIHPEFAGATCVSSTLCVDDLAQTESAEALYAEALAFVGANVVPVEGMAYGLSADPRAPLAEPFEGYRRDFLAWQQAIGKAQMWVEAGKL